MGGTLFEELGFYYVGPIDGHNLDHLIPVLEERQGFRGPAGSHPHHHQEGQGLRAGGSLGRQISRRVQVQRAHRRAEKGSGAVAFTRVFADALIAEAERDDKIVAVTAAMPSGTGLDLFGREFPDRCFDVGIAEQHAVTFCGGLAAEGFKPFATIYSTFLQRAYDQVVHDVAIQSLPVRFAIDRAGWSAPTGRRMRARST